MKRIQAGVLWYCNAMGERDFDAAKALGESIAGKGFTLVTSAMTNDAFVGKINEAYKGAGGDLSIDLVFQGKPRAENSDAHISVMDEYSLLDSADFLVIGGDIYDPRAYSPMVAAAMMVAMARSWGSGEKTCPKLVGLKESMGENTCKRLVSAGGSVLVDGLDGATEFIKDFEV